MNLGERRQNIGKVEKNSLSQISRKPHTCVRTLSVEIVGLNPVHVSMWDSLIFGSEMM